MVVETLSSRDPSIGMIIRNGGRDLVKVHVTEAVASYVSLLHSSRSVSAETVITMVDYFLENADVKQLRGSELKTFFNLAFKQQKYGKLYGGFGYDTLLDWFNQFIDERLQCIIDYRENQHNQYTMYEKQRRTREDGDAFGIGEIIKDNERTQDRDTHTNDKA